MTNESLDVIAARDKCIHALLLKRFPFLVNLAESEYNNFEQIRMFKEGLLTFATASETELEFDSDGYSNGQYIIMKDDEDTRLWSLETNGQILSSSTNTSELEVEATHHHATARYVTILNNLSSL